MTKQLVAIVTAIFLSTAEIFAALPQSVMKDLEQLNVLRTFRRVEAIPEPLQGALAKTFVQRKLWMANHNQNLRGKITPGIPLEEYPRSVNGREAIVVGPHNPSSPERRLLFAFETADFYYVYYEDADGAAALVFSKRASKIRKPLVWGWRRYSLQQLREESERIKRSNSWATPFRRPSVYLVMLFRLPLQLIR